MGLRIREAICAFAILWAAPAAAADRALVAVASNFLTAAETLEAAYETRSGHEITLAHGSTGRLFSQIVAGAPFDVFLAADRERPARLEADGRAEARATYALGRLVIVSKAADPDLTATRIAVADPRVAPYGQAAEAALREMGLQPETLDLVYGDNVGQAANMFVTGNAGAAFLAASLLPGLDPGLAVAPVAVAGDLLMQDGVLLARAAGNPAATGFFDFVLGPEGREIIAASGYDLP